MRTGVVFLFLGFCIGLVAGDWNILGFMGSKREEGDKEDTAVAAGLRNYCESWRMNVELNNIRGFEVVPGECVDYVGEYVTSTQYKVDVQRAAEEVILFLAHTFQLGGDGKDAWVFDVDDVLLSTVPYYQHHQFGYARLACFFFFSLASKELTLRGAEA
ncbi:hypothetical protein BHM03_00000756 [Ensete ventricosum]|nr:hypothetical protein BHM03_00000756 [Ensete ventricosum]